MEKSEKVLPIRYYFEIFAWKSPACFFSKPLNAFLICS